MNTRLMARLKGNVCFITVDGNGVVTGSQTPLTVTGEGEVQAQGQVQEMSSQGAPRDPAAPPETDAEKEVRLAKERENETPEQTAEREAAEVEAARKAALTEEEQELEGREAKLKEVTAKDKAWAERDKAKDVVVSPEQKAQIAKLAKTPEQISAMEEFTLETNTTNDLSPASRAKAAALWNVTPEMVDQYVASVISANKGTTDAPATYDDTSEDMAKWSPTLTKAYNDRMDALYEVAGGKDNWNQFSQWAEQSLRPEVMAALQQAISASPIVGATVAKTMIATWKAQGNGGGPADLSRGAGMGGRQAQPGVQPFASRQEQNSAIQDPRYAKDNAYRQSVDARMVISNFSQSNVEKSFYEGAGPMM